MDQTIAQAHDQITPVRIKVHGLMIDEKDIPLDVIFRVDLNHDLKMTTDGNLAFFDLEVAYFIPNERGGDRKVLTCAVQNVFRIGNMNELKNADGFVQLPNELLVNIVSLSISHTRAAVAIHTAGTAFQDTLMPVVDPIVATKAFIAAMQKKELA